MTTDQIRSRIQSIRVQIDQLLADIDGLEHDIDHNDANRYDQTEQSTPGQSQGGEGERFRTICQSYGIDLNGIDISHAERGIWWVVHNLGKVNSPKRYIESMLAKCPRVKEVGFRPPTAKLPDPDDQTIMGLPPDQVISAASGLTYDHYAKVRDQIPGFKQLFRTWDDVLASEMKKRVVTAYCLKEGIL